jgi:hypothetical protein
MSNSAKIACLEMDYEAAISAKRSATGLRRFLLALQACQLALDIYRVQRDDARIIRNA